MKYISSVRPYVALIAVCGGVALATNGTSLDQCKACVTGTGAGAGCIPTPAPTAPNKTCMLCVTEKCGADCFNHESIAAMCGY